MSVVDDVRKVLQDFLAPQLRELSARMESLEKVVEAKFEAQDAKFDSLNKQIEARFEAQDAKFESLGKQLEGISDKLDLDRRLTKLESQQVAVSAKSA